MSRSPELVRRFNLLGGSIECASTTPAVHERLGRLYAVEEKQHVEADAVFLRARVRFNQPQPGWTVLVDEELWDTCRSLGPALRSLEYAICLRFVARNIDLIILHGATVLDEAGAVFITGPSGAGKSTLALALAGRGLTVAGDDIALLDPREGIIRPLPRCFHLDARSRRLLGRSGLRLPARASRFGFVAPADLAPTSPCPAPLRHLVLLSGERGADTLLEELPQSFMLASLQAEAGWGELPAADCIESLRRLVSGSRSWRLHRGPLDRMAGLVAGLLRPCPAATTEAAATGAVVTALGDRFGTSSLPCSTAATTRRRSAAP